MSKIIVLAGAPEASKLDYSKTVDCHDPDVPVSLPSFSGSSSTKFTARWRQLASEPSQMRPELPQLQITAPVYGEMDHAPANFFSAREFVAHELSADDTDSDVSAGESRPSHDSNEADGEILSEFYDHSFSIHEAVPSSQLEQDSASSLGFTPSYTPGTPVYESSEDMFSMTSESSSGIMRTPSGRRLSQAPRPRKLTDLEEIPNAAFLSSIHPQTMTVNVIAGVLSIAPARKIQTKGQYGRAREVELVEMTVGDDTKSGFSISMWMPREMHVNWKDGAHEKPDGARSNLRRNLKLLRPRDIVLLQNVALSSFRGKVHGQSLRGDVTKADLLFRKKVDEDDLAGCYTVQNLRMATGKDQQIMKVKRVRDWMVEFVGEPRPSKTRRKGHGYGSMLPDDTQ